MDDIKCIQTTKGVLLLTRFNSKAVGWVVVEMVLKIRAALLLVCHAL